MTSRMSVAHGAQYNNSGAIKTVSRSRDERFMCFLVQLHGGFWVVENINISGFIWRCMIRAAYKAEVGRMGSLCGSCFQLFEWFHILATIALL
jgi:hypothetical protein